MYKLLVVTLLAVSAYGAVLPEAPIKGIGEGRIVGGDPADISDAPWQVALLYDSSGSGSYNLRCGGSIYTPTVIITAAHCVSGTAQARWRIRAGSTTHSSGGQTVDGQRFVFHASYSSSTIDYDIAIIFLSGSVSIDGTNTATIPLPTQGQAVADGAPAFVTGWGSTFSGGSVVASLRKVTIPVVNQDACRTAYSGFNTVTDRMICGGNLANGGQDACQGDSGGPFIVGGELIGITSWGRGCALAGFPGVWTRVPALRTWIDQQM